MGQAIAVRTDYTSGRLRRLAQRRKNAAQPCRLMAIAAVLDGASRRRQRRSGGMDRQTLRDCVILAGLPAHLTEPRKRLMRHITGGLDWTPKARERLPGAPAVNLLGAPTCRHACGFCCSRSRWSRISSNRLHKFQPACLRPDRSDGPCAASSCSLTRASCSATWRAAICNAVSASLQTPTNLNHASPSGEGYFQGNNQMRKKQRHGGLSPHRVRLIRKYLPTS
jgi:hypothetical protein